MVFMITIIISDANIILRSLADHFWAKATPKGAANNKPATIGKNT